MPKLKLMSLNGEDMIELIPKSLGEPRGKAAARGKSLGDLIKEVDPDVLGLVEAPPSEARTQKFNEPIPRRRVQRVPRRETGHAGPRFARA